MKHFYRTAAAALLSLLLLHGASAAAPETLIVGGSTIGLRMETEGVSVVEFSDTSARNAGLERGDLLKTIDGYAVERAADVTALVERSAGRPMKLTVLRGGKEKELMLAPRQTANGWRLGIYVRDGITGIGTVTYYDPSDGSFGALGHGVNDAATASLLPMRSGSVLRAEVVSVTRGQKGAAGALQGAVCGRETCGSILRNTPQGIFGTMEPLETETMPVGRKSEVHTGAATIRSNVRGSDVREYSVQIRAVYPNEPHGHDLLLEVTDPALLSQTGGIVQGMSGSPIIQDGKLIGAVTHVLIDDPRSGYGIFIENMLNAAG